MSNVGRSIDQKQIFWSMEFGPHPFRGMIGRTVEAVSVTYKQTKLSNDVYVIFLIHEEGIVYCKHSHKRKMRTAAL